MTPLQIEALALAAEVQRALHRFGSSYLYAGNPPCHQCGVALGNTEDCPTCAEKRAQGAAAGSP